MYVYMLIYVCICICICIHNQHVVKERFEKKRQVHQVNLAQDFVQMIAMEVR